MQADTVAILFAATVAENPAHHQHPSRTPHSLKVTDSTLNHQDRHAILSAPAQKVNHQELPSQPLTTYNPGDIYTSDPPELVQSMNQKLQARGYPLIAGGRLLRLEKFEYQDILKSRLTDLGLNSNQLSATIDAAVDVFYEKAGKHTPHQIPACFDEQDDIRELVVQSREEYAMSSHPTSQPYPVDQAKNEPLELDIDPASSSEDSPKEEPSQYCYELAIASWKPNATVQVYITEALGELQEETEIEESASAVLQSVNNIFGVRPATSKIMKTPKSFVWTDLPTIGNMLGRTNISPWKELSHILVGVHPGDTVVIVHEELQQRSIHVNHWLDFCHGWRHLKILLIVNESIIQPDTDLRKLRKSDGTHGYLAFPLGALAVEIQGMNSGWQEAKLFVKALGMSGAAQRALDSSQVKYAYNQRDIQRVQFSRDLMLGLLQCWCGYSIRNSEVGRYHFREHLLDNHNRILNNLTICPVLGCFNVWRSADEAKNYAHIQAHMTNADIKDCVLQHRAKDRRSRDAGREQDPPIGFIYQCDDCPQHLKFYDNDIALRIHTMFTHPATWDEQVRRLPHLIGYEPYFRPIRVSRTENPFLRNGGLIRPASPSAEQTKADKWIKDVIGDFY